MSRRLMMAPGSKSALLVIGGENAKLSTSTDAATWTPRTSGFGTNAIRGVAWSPSLGRMVAVSDNKLIRYSADGVSWTAASSIAFASTNHFRCVAWSSVLGLYVVGGNSFGDILSSADGSTWTQRLGTLGSSSDVVALTWSDGLGKFVGIGGNNTSYASTNGTTWTNPSTATGIFSPFSIATNSACIVVGASNSIYRSTDGGATWTTVYTPAGGANFVGIAWSESLGKFLAVDAVTANAYTSPTGVTWTAAGLLPGSPSLSGVIWSPTLNLFIAYGGYGTSDVFTSPTGATWTGQSSGFTTSYSPFTMASSS